MLLSNSKLHIQTLGSGQHLALIHGWAMHGAVWQPIVKTLSKFFTLHLVDLPGMGLSEPVTPYHLHSLAEKVAENLPNGTDILGWSLGGQVAMRIALDQPEVVRKLILVGTTPCYVNKTGLSTQKNWHFGIEANIFKRFAQNVQDDYHKTMTQFLTLQCMGSKHMGSTMRLLKQQFAERPTPSPAILQDALQILLDTDLRNEVDSLTKSTLLIHGDQDMLAPVAAANWMRQHLHYGLLRVIAGASHAPFLSHPTQFTDALLEFLLPNAAN